MEGIQDIKEMLRTVLEQQEKLTQQQEKLIIKVEGMEAIQNAQAEMMKGMEHEVQKIDEMEKRMGGMEQQVGEAIVLVCDGLDAQAGPQHTLRLHVACLRRREDRRVAILGRSLDVGP